MAILETCSLVAARDSRKIIHCIIALSKNQNSIELTPNSTTSIRLWALNLLPTPLLTSGCEHWTYSQLHYFHQAVSIELTPNSTTSIRLWALSSFKKWVTRQSRNGFQQVVSFCFEIEECKIVYAVYHVSKSSLDTMPNFIHFILALKLELVIAYHSRVAQGAYLEVEYIRNVLSVSGTLKYADSGTAWCHSGNIEQFFLEPF